MYSQAEILKFINCFNGAKEFYGTTIVGEIVNGKAQSTSSCIHEPPSPSIFANHLAGKNSIGLSPLKADNMVSFGAIDIDSYKGDLMLIIKAIYDFDMPICPCYSKSKKLHLYFFFEQGTDADDAVEIMRWYACAFRCDRKVEIFPKQIARTVSNKAYSWINLPYFDANDMSNHRKMVKKDGSYASLEDFLERAEQCRVSKAIHRELIERYPCYDAPPCIKTGAILRDIGAGGRNNWMFSAAIYFKLKDENCDVAEKIHELNESLPDPLPEAELEQTVIKSVSRKVSFYICSSMEDLCDKQACKRLEYGIGSKQNPGVTFGPLTQQMTDPPQYEWRVGTTTMHFYTEAELISQDKFRELSLRDLHILPKKLDPNVWGKIVNKAAKTMETKELDSQGNDFTAGSRFIDLVVQFFTDKRRAQNESQIRLGRVYASEAEKTYWFNAWSLLTYIKDTNGFKGMKDMEIRQRMCAMGAYKEGMYWKLPMDALPTVNMEEANKPVDIDLNDGEGTSEDF